jgi:hypothetical protein
VLKNAIFPTAKLGWSEGVGGLIFEVTSPFLDVHMSKKVKSGDLVLETHFRIFCGGLT